MLGIPVAQLSTLSIALVHLSGVGNTSTHHQVWPKLKSLPASAPEVLGLEAKARSHFLLTPSRLGYSSVLAWNIQSASQSSVCRR